MQTLSGCAEPTREKNLLTKNPFKCYQEIDVYLALSQDQRRFSHNPFRYQDLLRLFPVHKRQEA
jgi:hypothetical protein